jgi:hypothetical protein
MRRKPQRLSTLPLVELVFRAEAAYRRYWDTPHPVEAGSTRAAWAIWHAACEEFPSSTTSSACAPIRSRKRSRAG